MKKTGKNSADLRTEMAESRSNADIKNGASAKIAAKVAMGDNSKSTPVSLASETSSYTHSRITEGNGEKSENDAYFFSAVLDLAYPHITSTGTIFIGVLRLSKSRF